MFRLKFILCALIVLFVGIGLLIDGMNNAYRDHRLNSKGKIATVVGIVSGGQGRSDEVKLLGEDGEEFTERMYVPPEVPYKVMQHEKITVDYLPGDTWVNRWTGDRAQGGLEFLFGLFLCAAGGCLMRIFTR